MWKEEENFKNLLLLCNKFFLVLFSSRFGGFVFFGNEQNHLAGDVRVIKRLATVEMLRPILTRKDFQIALAFHLERHESRARICFAW